MAADRFDANLFGMAKTSQKALQAQVIKKLESVSDDPQTFEDLISTWNSYFDLNNRAGETTFADVENAALASITSVAGEEPGSAVGRQVGHLLETFSSAAFLVRENGRVLAQNSAALRIYDLGADATLDDLPFDLEQNEPIADLVRASLDPQRNMRDAILRRGFSKSDDSSVTLSIAPSKMLQSGQGEALVFVVDSRWKTEAAGLIKREFDLTEAERELLVSFLDGQSTQDIAKSRGRSHATVRTQFHSLMSKMGARSQVELFRNALSITQFVDKVGEIAEVLRHPHRKRVDLVRPGGRSVEVTLCGDLSGTPVVYLPHGASYTFERHVEQGFYEAGLCVMSLCRPGFGDTDPAPKGGDAIKTFVDDVGALLDQLGHSRCLLMAANTSSGYMHIASRHLSERVAGLVHIAALVPRIYYRDEDEANPWSKALYRAMSRYPSLSAFIVKSGTRAWVKQGQAAFFKSQLKSRARKPILDRILLPEALAESQKALDVATKQGIDQLAEDARLAFSDFSRDVAACDIPILLIHGTQDPLFAVQASRQFAAALGDRVRYVEIKDADYAPLDTHTPQIISEILEFQAEVTR